ncbi:MULTISPECIES: AAA family ATPase [unclassified Arthrobacter]|uniref:AAA family ATPase n=1 Tax=unclassified Arthrobacter TaxID=235627 RepID=UPI0008959779|nr:MULTISPECIES: AAA family ATPase [unclassified Arthrobacter]SDX60223.1 AAA domain-containing protein, putative AbiEii toxin, Type IV TA system [Arthrobacter sp. cf158]
MISPHFVVVSSGAWPVKTARTFTLVVDMWDDFHYKTSFMLYYGTGDTALEIGAVKIAPLRMAERDPHTKLPATFTQLSPEFYSLGQDREYYVALAALPNDIGRHALRALRDIAESPTIFKNVEDEPALGTSLLRSIPINTVTVQFSRIIQGRAPLTPYRFSYSRSTVPPFRLEFGVDPDVMPPTNVHVLIGANGVGKSSLLRDLVAASCGSEATSWTFSDEMTTDISADPHPVPFANVVHVAFSAFDLDNMAPFSSEVDVHFVGLSSREKESLDVQFAKSLLVCSKGRRRDRWLAAVRTLAAADAILADANLDDLINSKDAQATFSSMSSGHKIVLLTVTRLVELVEERSLILIDEPETHLHPPLLSALTRAVSDLVIDRNGVAITATHSPVVLQEVPRSCVWMLQRSGDDFRASRLATETFGESVSRLTSEVFHLDINRTGYNQVLVTLLDQNDNSALRVMEALDWQLGSEGRFVLSALDYQRDEDYV